TIPIGAVNWQDLSRTGASMFTSAWASYQHDVGEVTVAVTGGKVSRILYRYEGEDAPPPGTTYLTARWGSNTDDQLQQLRVGDKVTISVPPTGKLQYQKKATAIGRPTSLTGLSAPLVVNGQVVYGCSRQSEIRRPRSIVAWKKNGDVMLIAISGRAFSEDLRI